MATLMGWTWLDSEHVAFSNFEQWGCETTKPPRDQGVGCVSVTRDQRLRHEATHLKHACKNA